jgi:radical SAM protein with 4Fe4S-binding SPASM domain
VRKSLQPQYRPERFGGIVSMHRPRGLAYVDRDYARSLGFPESPLWEEEDAGLNAGPLSAPTEVHLVISRRCSAGCTGCYVDATPDGPALTEAEAKAALDRLAEMGVFHVALGGGEAVDLPYLLDVARHARKRGIVPNLTTSGLPVDEAFAREAAAVFGQVNVSVDGLGEDYRRSRGYDGFARAEDALRLLRSFTPHVGINCVVSRDNADRLAPLVAFAKRLRLSEVEFLRFKPAGRGSDVFGDRDLTPEQGRKLYRRALWYALRYRMRIKLDCSFAPMVYAHNPPKALVDFFGVMGCVGGDVLASIMPDGQWIGCSFGGPSEGRYDEAGVWQKGFGSFRDYVKRAPEPCASCDYLSLCRGGCRVVAKAAGDWWQPDPGCPKVQDWKAAHPGEAIGTASPEQHKLRVLA